MEKKKDIIKILNSNSRDNLSGLTSDKLEVGELALITETNYERLYCKNSNGDVVPIFAELKKVGFTKVSLGTQ